MLISLLLNPLFLVSIDNTKAHKEKLVNGRNDEPPDSRCVVILQGDSQPSAGTLSHAKDYLNARNVTSDASKYYDCSALFDKLFHAYIRTGILL